MHLLLVALVVLAGLIIGLVAGILSRLTGTHPAKAALDGGTAWCAAVTLGVLLLSTVGLL